MQDGRKGASDELYAGKFPLGWDLLGPTNPHKKFSREAGNVY